MNSNTRPEENRYRRRLAAIIVVGTLAVAGLSVGSLAIFTDQQAVGPNSFHAGTIKLALDGTSTWSGFATTDMKPGDTVGPVALKVENTGENQLRYAVVSSVDLTNDPSHLLASAIQVTIKPDASVGHDCTTQGSAIYTGSMYAIAIGSPNVGPDTGDRTVNNGASEYLCVTADLPFHATAGATFPTTNTDNVLQGLTTALTLTFDAEQTKNNP